MNSIINPFLAGICMLAYGASGFFFFKFWRHSRDRFFLFFAWSCWLISIERVAAIVASPNGEPRSWVYLFRLCAFMFLMAAIAVKNRNHDKAE